MAIGRFSSQKVDLNKIDLWELPHVEHSRIYWDGEERKPFSSFHEKLPDEVKAKVLAYLRSGTEWSACPGIFTDDVTGERLPIQWLNYTDGHYSWNSKTIYQFYHYDMKLPDDFIKHILRETK